MARFYLQVANNRATIAEHEVMTETVREAEAAAASLAEGLVAGLECGESLGTGLCIIIADANGNSIMAVPVKGAPVSQGDAGTRKDGSGRHHSS